MKCVNLLLCLTLLSLLVVSCQQASDRFVQNHILEREPYWNNAELLADIHQRDSIRSILEEQLAQYEDKTKDPAYLEILARLARIAEQSYSFDECMRYGMEGASLAERMGDIEMNAFFQNMIGHIMFDDEEYECGGYFANACHLLKDTDDPQLMKRCAQYALDCYDFYFQLVMTQEADHYLDVAMDMVNHSVERQPGVWNEVELDSIYGIICCDRARLFAFMNQKESAQEWYAKYLETYFSRSYLGRINEVMYLERANEDEKALSLYTDLEQYFDTASNYENVTAELPRLRFIKVRILWGLERWKDCCEAYEKYEDARHYWHKRYSHNKMLDSYERYGVLREQTKKVNAQQVSERRLVLLFVLGILAAFLGVLSVLLYSKERDIKRKNKVLASHIKQMLDERETFPEPQFGIEGEEKESPEDLAVGRFINEVKSRRLFCDPDFDRNELMEQMKLSTRTFALSFENVTGMNIYSFILNLRLDYAAELIRNNANYTIDSIALESGFTSRSTFYRHFTRQFGISPTEFRMQCEGEQKK